MLEQTRTLNYLLCKFKRLMTSQKQSYDKAENWLCNLQNGMRKTEHWALKLTIFIIEHKLSWATAHFVRCNGMKMQSKQVLHNGIKRNKQTYVT